jgi:hypothetical protein
MHARADGEHDGVVARRELLHRHVVPDVDAVLEPHSLGLELADAPIDEPLLELEVRHAEAQQAARALVALVHDHVVPGAVELLGGGQAGRA